MSDFSKRETWEEQEIPQPKYSKISAAEMQVGDIIRLRSSSFSPWNTTVVKRIDEENNSVTLFRPFVHVSGPETTSGIFCYLGIEEYTIYRNTTDKAWELIDGDSFQRSEKTDREIHDLCRLGEKYADLETKYNRLVKELEVIANREKSSAV